MPSGARGEIAPGGVDHRDALGREPLRGVRQLDLRVEVREIHLRAGRHLVHDLGNGRSMRLPGAGLYTVTVKIRLPARSHIISSGNERNQGRLTYGRLRRISRLLLIELCLFQTDQLLTPWPAS